MEQMNIFETFSTEEMLAVGNKKAKPPLRGEGHGAFEKELVASFAFSSKIDLKTDLERFAPPSPRMASGVSDLGPKAGAFERPAHDKADDVGDDIHAGEKNDSCKAECVSSDDDHELGESEEVEAAHHGEDVHDERVENERHAEENASVDDGAEPMGSANSPVYEEAVAGSEGEETLASEVASLEEEIKVAADETAKAIEEIADLPDDFEAQLEEVSAGAEESEELASLETEGTEDGEVAELPRGAEESEETLKAETEGASDDIADSGDQNKDAAGEEGSEANEERLRGREQALSHLSDEQATAKAAVAKELFSQGGVVRPASEANQVLGEAIRSENNMVNAASQGATQATEAAKAAAATKPVPLGAGFEKLVVKDVSAKMSVMYKNGEGKATLRLDPPDLGRLKVELIVKDSLVKATIAAENVVVKEALESNLAGLKQALTDQGLNVEDINVTLDDKSSGSSDNQGDKSKANGKEERGLSLSAHPGSLNGTTGSSAADSGLDIFI